MATIVKRNLPNSGVALNGIKDAATRDAIMRLNENVTSLKRQLEELQTSHIIVDRDVKGILSRLTSMAVV